MTLEFFIPIEPVPQGRPRFKHITTKEGKPCNIAYDPPESRKFKEAIKRHVQKLKIQPFDRPVPLALRLQFFLTRPKSASRQYPTVKPDLDNLEKGVKDALKGLAWHDDCQVCQCLKWKKYAPEGQQAGIWVTVYEIKD